MTRQLLKHVFIAAIFTSSLNLCAIAQDNRTIKAYVGYVAGSSTDIAARIVAQALSDELKQNVIVENRELRVILRIHRQKLWRRWNDFNCPKWTCY
jgi:tripartite-type tricarboxylate transporter receptor subunit TctC